MQRIPVLLHTERDQYEAERDQRKELISAHPFAQPAFRHETQQGDRDEQVDPQPTGRSRLVMRKDDDRCSEHGAAPAEQAERGRSNKHQQEQVEQLPSIHPCALRIVCSPRGQQPMTRRQMQSRLHVVEARIPTGRRACTVARHACERRELHDLIAYLDAGAAIRAVGDQHHLVVAPCIEQAIWRQHVETPALLHRARDVVGGDEVVVIERQPQRAPEREPMRVGTAEPATAFRDRDRGAARQTERRHAAPLVGHTGLDRIDRRRAFERGDAQSIVACVTPDLLVGPRTFALRNHDRVRCRRGTRDDNQLMLARAHLHAQPSVRLEAHRQFAGRRHRHEAIGQHAREHFLACVAGDFELQACLQSKRNIVLEQAINLHLQCARHGYGAHCAEPQTAGAQLHRSNRSSVDAQIDERRDWRKLQRLRPTCPGETAADRVIAGAQT